MEEQNLYQEAEKYIPAGYNPNLYKIRHSAAHILAQAVPPPGSSALKQGGSVW